MQIDKIKEEIVDDGFAIVDDIFSNTEVEEVIRELTITDTADPAFRKTGDLFAIRRVLQMVPGLAKLVFNQRLRQLVQDIFGSDFFVVKSIYFDKPACPTGLWLTIRTLLYLWIRKLTSVDIAYGQ